MAGPGKKRTARTVEIADHLWERLEAMSLEMGAEPDTLVNQALHAFAREHGYLKPGELAGLLSTPHDDGEDTKNEVPDLKIAEAAAMKATGSNGPRVTMQPVSRAAAEGATSLTAQLYRANERPDRSATNKVRQVKESKPQAPLTEPVAAVVEPPPETESKVDLGPVPDYLPAEVTGAELSPLLSPRGGPKAGGDRTVVGKPAERKLFVIVDGKITQEVSGARYVIGRDTACQLALPSNRISRQHVAVVKDGGSYAIEDMGSSNGTWFKNERITRRPIGHGDEYAIGDISLRFEYR